MEPAVLVRLKWSEFQRWLEPRRRTMERQHEEITKEQDAKWSSTPAKSKAKKEAQDANKAKLIQALEDKHFGEARDEWHVRLERARLSDDAWGEMTRAEQVAISGALGGDLDEEDDDPVLVEDLTVHKWPQANAPFLGPVPILSSASRTSNFSTSSYTLVSPADLKSDDEHYVPGFSYLPPADDSDDDEVISRPVPIQNGNADAWSPWSSTHSSLNGSPDQPDSKSLPDSGYSTFPPAIKVEPKPTSRRPAESEPNPGATTRVRGPKYVGPQLSDSDEASEEEADFEKFKMVTRITKIVEFHHAAALADIDLALSICNGRMTKELGKVEEGMKVAQHEKRMLELQATKENERKAVVSAERKKRRDELRNRSILRKPIPTADPSNYDALFNPSAFRVDLDMNGAFAVRREKPSPKEMERPVNGLSSRSGQPAPEIPPSQSAGRETPIVASGKQSAWKLKSTPSALSQAHPIHDDAATPTPERVVDAPWSSIQRNPFAQSTSLENGDSRIPGAFPVESMVKGTSGWGKKSSASGSLNKPTDGGSASQAHDTPFIATNGGHSASPPIEPVRPASPTIPSSSKKPTKKQRQGIKKPGAANPSLNKGEVEPPSPAIPTSTASSSKAPTELLHIAEKVNGSSVAQDEELSSTPRSNLMMKRQGPALGMAKPTPIIRGNDPASTPRPSVLRQLATIHDPNESTVEESPWERMAWKKAQTTDHQGAQSSKQGASWNGAMKQKPPVPDHRSAHFSASSSSGADEEETLWNRVMKLKSQSQAPQSSSLNTAPRSLEAEEETPWQRAMRLKGQNQAPHGASMLPSNVVEDEAPWERTVRVKGQNQFSWGPGSSTTKPMIAETSESFWEQVVKKTSHQGSEHSSTISTKPQGSAVSSFWQGEHTDDRIPHPDFPSSRADPYPVHQGDHEFWRPGGVTWGVPPSAARHQMWNPSGRTQPPQTEKSGSVDDPTSRAREVNRVRGLSDPVSPSPRLEFTDLPDVDDRAFVPTSILKGPKSKNPPVTNKKVTIEDIPDEEAGWPDEKLPSTSRYVLDIAEPKPSVPTNVYAGFLDFAAEAEEDDTGSSSLALTPSTAPTSPPSEVLALDDNELMAEIQNGGWENLLAGNSSRPAQNTKHAPWPSSSFETETPSYPALDSAKLQPALQSVNDTPPMTENINVPVKPAPVSSVPDSKENKEPVAKPSGGGKAKGKGKKKGGR